MPTLISHPAVPVALALALGSKRVPPWLLVAGVVASVLPDVDGLSYKLGVPLDGSNMWGHRGYTHTLAFALGVAAVGTLLVQKRKISRSRLFAWLFICCFSHPLLDMFTHGGAPIPLLWPISAERLSASWQPLEVSPLALSRLLSPRMVEVWRSELLFLWLPLCALALAVRWLSTRK